MRVFLLSRLSSAALCGILPLFFALMSPVGVSADDAQAADSQVAQPSGPIAFDYQIVPIFNRKGCNTAACHGAENGRGGFRLSLFGAYPELDHQELVREDAGRRIDLNRPQESLLIKKITDRVPHKGGKLFEPGSPELGRLTAWIWQGARLEPPAWGDMPAPESLTISPAGTVKMKKDERTQLAVSLIFTDESKSDVTADAAYVSSDPSVVKVTDQGEIEAVGFGQADVVTTYLRRRDIVRVVIPQPLDRPFAELAAEAEAKNPETAPPASRIDELVGQKLAELGFPPSPVCTDDEFLRRIYIDLIGVLPTPVEIEEFRDDTSKDKRARLVEQLFQRDEYSDRWAMKWSDLLRVKSEYPSKLWPNAAWGYHRWIKSCIARNMPYDQFVRELITSTGSNFRVPAVNYYRAFLNRRPQQFAEATSVLFMGARLSCARCHAHPTEEWDIDDNLGMAAFFGGVRYKRTSEWKEEIIYANRTAYYSNPHTQVAVKPRFLGTDEALTVKPGEDPRVRFADWLITADNPWFARSIVNRVWFWMMGRGIVHQADDMRPSNPPTNPELLDYLAGELVESGWDLRHIYRLIINSRTYQRSSVTTEWNAVDRVHFSHYPLRRIEAEILLDIISQATGKWDSFTSRVPEPYTFVPSGFRSVQVADGTISNATLNLFGRPARDSAYESQRCSDTSMRLALHFINSSDIESRIASGKRLTGLMKEGKTDEQIVTILYQVTFSRLPTDEERENVMKYISEHKVNRTWALRDVFWALLNSQEFIFNH